MNRPSISSVLHEKAPTRLNTDLSKKIALRTESAGTFQPGKLDAQALFRRLTQKLLGEEKERQTPAEEQEQPSSVRQGSSSSTALSIQHPPSKRGVLVTGSQPPAASVPPDTTPPRFISARQEPPFAHTMALEDKKFHLKEAIRPSTCAAAELRGGGRSHCWGASIYYCRFRCWLSSWECCAR